MDLPVNNNIISYNTAEMVAIAPFASHTSPNPQISISFSDPVQILSVISTNIDKRILSQSTNQNLDRFLTHWYFSFLWHMRPRYGYELVSSADNQSTPLNTSSDINQTLAIICLDCSN